MAPQQSPWTHNVILGLIVSALYALGEGMYIFTVLPGFILAVGGDNFSVGFAEGVQGIATMASALPAGYLADKVSRTACVRIGSLIQIAQTFCFLGALWHAEPGNRTSYNYIVAALILQGITDGIVQGPMVALMDDSVPAGKRSDVETANYTVYAATSGIGPAIGYFIFLYYGNNWTIESMRVVIITGVLLSQLVIVPQWLMDNKKTLGVESEAVHLQERFIQADGDAETETAAAGEANEVQKRNKQTACFGLITADRICWALFIGNTVTALGAGMTVKFFPVFFEKACKLDPGSIQLVMAAVSIAVCPGALICQWVAKRIGRLQVMLMCFSVGICCTALLGLLRPYYTVPFIMLPIFFARCTIMWSCGALGGSVVADYTPKDQRGRWKALQSITSMGWSGSAMLGGYLIDRYGYGVTFIMTAAFQATVLPLWCALLPMIAKESEFETSATPVKLMTPVASFKSPGARTASS